MTRRAALTPDELERIAELTEERGLKPGQIARLIGCSVGSVGWAQLRIGADPHPDRPLPPVPATPVTFSRASGPVRRFTRTEDDQLLKLEAAGFGPAQIGARLIPPRRWNSVKGRLMTLARRQAREEAAEVTT